MKTDDARRLYEAEGPFATVYLAAPGEVENALQRLGVEWKNVRRELEEQGADDKTLAALEDAVEGAHGEGDTVAAVAAGGALLLTEALPEPPVRSVGHWGALPYLAPLLEWSQSLLPHVVVLADREGADIVAFTGTVAELEAELHGDTEHIHRGKPGGWSSRRFQQRAENTWEHNADDVASAVSTMSEAIGAELVVAAGDVRAIQLLGEALPPRHRERLRVLDNGQRAMGVSIDDIADDVVKQVATVVAEETVALTRKFKEEHGQHDRAADGPARTLEALARAQVETLLIHDDPDDERLGWFGPDGVHVALDRQTLLDMGVEEPREARLVDVALRAAILTGAAVRIVPGGAAPTKGIGAILRHTGTAPGGAR